MSWGQFSCRVGKPSTLGVDHSGYEDMVELFFIYMVMPKWNIC